MKLSKLKVSTFADTFSFSRNIFLQSEHTFAIISTQSRNTLLTIGCQKQRFPGRGAASEEGGYYEDVSGKMQILRKME